MLFSIFNLKRNLEILLFIISILAVYAENTSAGISDNTDVSHLPNLGLGVVIKEDNQLPHLKYGVVTLEFVRKPILCKRHECSNLSIFRGGASVNGVDYYPRLIVHTSQLVSIVGEIDVNPAHIGKTVDILIVAGFIPPNSNKVADYFMLDTQGKVWRWNRDIYSLVAVQEAITLPAMSVLEMYHGLLGGQGKLLIYFGYRLESGLIAFNGGQPIVIRIVEKIDSEHPVD